MIQASPISFDDLYSIDASITEEQASFLRQSYESLAALPTMTEQMQQLKQRLDSMPEPHNRVMLRSEPKAQIANFHPFNFRSYAAGQSMTTVNINFDQINQTIGCDLNTLQPAYIFQNHIVIFAHEIAGHAADPAKHHEQDYYMAHPQTQEWLEQYREAYANQDEETMHQIDLDFLYFNIREQENILSSFDRNLRQEDLANLPYGNYYETYAVQIADRIRKEAFGEGTPLREVYLNTNRFTIAQQLESHEIPQAEHRGILSDWLSKNISDLGDLGTMPTEELHREIEKARCADLAHTIEDYIDQLEIPIEQIITREPRQR